MSLFEDFEPRTVILGSVVALLAALLEWDYQSRKPPEESTRGMSTLQVVPKVGLEPTCLSAADLESATSAIPSLGHKPLLQGRIIKDPG